MVPNRAVAAAFAVLLVVFVPLRAAQEDPVTELSPTDFTLRPASIDADGDRAADSYVLQKAPDTGALIVVLGSEEVPTEFVLTPPLGHGLLLNASGEVVITWVLEAVAGAEATVNVVLTSGSETVGSGSASGQTVANQPTTFQIRFAPGVATLQPENALTLAVSLDATPPQPGMTHNLPECKLELPIAAVLGVETNTTANNTTDEGDDDDTPALGFALIAAGVGMAAWVAGRRRRAV